MAVDHRISPLKKSDLQYKYPSGPTAGDDPSVRGMPDLTLLNRHEWYEVLYFVNKFANLFGRGQVEVAKKAERLIHTKLPSNLRSHQHVEDWLKRNWSMFPSV